MAFSSDLRLESDEKRDSEFSHGATRFRFYAYRFERPAFWTVKRGVLRLASAFEKTPFFFTENAYLSRIL